MAFSFIVFGLVPALYSAKLKVPGYIPPLLMTCAFGVQLSLYLFPWSSWLPGTSFLNGEASFLVRYSALFTFLGFILTIVTFAASIAFSIWWGRKPTSIRTESNTPLPPDSPLPAMTPPTA
jgi:hypothetical protein